MDVKAKILKLTNGDEIITTLSAEAANTFVTAQFSSDILMILENQLCSTGQKRHIVYLYPCCTGIFIFSLIILYPCGVGICKRKG